MKTIKLMALYALLACCPMAFGQTKCTIIEFDFIKKQFTNIEALEKLEQGDWYQIKIVNINKNLYSVGIDKTDSIFKSEIKTPDFGLFNFDALSKIAGGLSPFATIAAVSLVESQINRNEKFNFIQDLPKKSSNKYKDSSDIKVKMNEYIAQIKKLNDGIKGVKSSIEVLQFEVAKYLLIGKIELNNSNNYTTLNSTPKFNFIEALKKIQGLRNTLDSIKSNTITHQTDYLAYYEKHKATIDSVASLKGKDASIKENYDGLIKTSDEAFASINAEKSNQLLGAIITIENNANCEYMGMPMQFNGDMNTLKLSLTPRAEELKLQTYKTVIKFPQPTLHYVGVGMSFYLSGLYDEAYSIKAIKADTVKQYSLVKENVQKQEFGTAFILRYGRKLNKKSPFGAHFAFGPAITISDKVKARIVLGGGFSIGKKHMLVLDFGVISGYVDRLSNVYQNYQNESYFEKPEMPVISTLKTNYFGSLGYMYRF